jgi:type I restriction enzyme R subunit
MASSQKLRWSLEAIVGLSGNPKFTALGERLEKIKERHEQGFLTSLEFLKQILELAREVETEKQTDPG